MSKSKGMPHTTPAKGAGKVVRSARLKKGWSQAALAEKAGVSQMAVSYVEHGGTGPSREAICKALGIRKKAKVSE